MEILVATTNKHKLGEIRRILKGARVRGLAIRVREDGKTFEANAVKKARAGAKKTGKITIADDSGLMVDCLGGRPGVRSARFANPPTSENLCNKLLKVMSNEQCVARRARFACAIAIVYPSGKVKVVKGICRGKIIHEMRGKGGFGYDPVFVPLGYKKTFAEMKPAMKNRISHRAKALRILKYVV
ncbi:non-canonical purine NTP pyrophosphatase, RdgB/HAM1 family [candidate division WOR-1 bacterium RIFCSPLOWO2_02_FULL_46_20]|uniref:dITP/XTP pyrophosphatase n=1 Tax=candidate division WOR-1 bacterium RIFCSPLOWO2_02_FULL_46_20 TaxID=1802567 RepID=A0A1F4RB99_UNCSA|nr:MAG: non-canonical purine NTP pyrophosphatase, RdgB/HAM1 family [candidate division WOR-1 bacterium RIFCSPLOWO2_02_FULL_46_20]